MKPLTLEWVEKAEGDFATAEREWRVREIPNDAIVKCRQVRRVIRRSMGLEP